MARPATYGRAVFYRVATLLMAAGWGWLAMNNIHEQQVSLQVCWFRNITGIACPSCGTTTSILHLLHGEAGAAASANILGFAALAALLALPAWLLADYVCKRNSLYHMYCRLNTWLKEHPLRLLLILFIIAINWIWILYTNL